MADALLTVEGLSKQYGERNLFERVSFGIQTGQKVALVARNGQGKSTLLNIITGRELQDEGKVTFRSNCRMAYLEQAPATGSSITVSDFIFGSDNKFVRATGRYESCLQELQRHPSPDTERLMQECINEMDALDAWTFENRAKEILSKLGINDLEQPIITMSGGEQKKLALARTLVDDVDLLLLDEPTNHLDIGMIEWLEEFLAKQRLAILMVTHDRYFLDNVCNEILELDNHTLYHYAGNYSYYLEQKAEREAIARSEVAKARSLYRTELEWMRRMPQARGTKARARVDAFYELEAKAHTRFDDRKVELSVKTERIGGKILELYNIGKQYEGHMLLDDFTYTFKQGEKVGIVGPNGVGKSTLLNIITGRLRPDSGRVVIGQTINFGFYTQQGMQANPDARVIDILKEVAEVIELDHGKKLTAHQFLSHFGFDDTTQYNSFGNLSGGERRRLYLLTVLMSNPNFLILDEPTNDLDIYTLQLLERFLQDYKGCVLMVSHDRCFMDHIVDHLWVFEGAGRIRDYHSTYSDYREARQLAEREANRAQQQQRKAAAPVRQKPASTKATYKEKCEYESLTTELEQLNNERSELEQLLSSGEITDANLLQNYSQRIGELMELIDTKEFRWLELDEKING
ncbi:MAG: ABC-F family ATP-binding cassette domain-containing protein [Bacteroidales bacterium]|nr:ABC-F family ATP-binding cassette domain-containing protein [Bacteroidales bacterium]